MMLFYSLLDLLNQHKLTAKFAENQHKVHKYGNNFSPALHPLRLLCVHCG